MFNWLENIDKNYANAIQALTPFVIGISSFIYYKFYKESKIKVSRDGKEKWKTINFNK